MKTTIVIAGLLFSFIGLNGQSIRKDYREMTIAEKAALTDAFFQLRNNGDLINDLSLFHAAFFNFDNTFDPTRRDIHFNLPDEPERDIFFTWHRMQIFEVEQAMQDINPMISMPFWNSTNDQSLSSALWDDNFMGQFNLAWNLNRNPGAAGALPTPAILNNTFSLTNFLLFSDAIERGPIHEGAHRWIGGVMMGPPSPRDPLFYLHHTFVDKVWHDWEEINQSSSYISTSMLRYDGTYSFNGQLLPLINPNDIVNSRSLGVFYADDQHVKLDEYSVSNNYNTPETFFYQYEIEICNNFAVEKDKSCEVVSENRILLKPGFHAANGSTFHARIQHSDQTQQMQQATQSLAFNTKSFVNSDFDIAKNYYKPDESFDDQWVVFPNPFTNHFEINSNNETSISEIKILNILSGIEWFSGVQKDGAVRIDGLENLKPGLYLLQITASDGRIFSEKIIKK